MYFIKIILRMKNRMREIVTDAIRIPLWSLHLDDGIYYNYIIQHYIGWTIRDLHRLPASHRRRGLCCARRDFTVAGCGHDTIILLLSRYDTPAYHSAEGQMSRLV